MMRGIRVCYICLIIALSSHAMMANQVDDAECKVPALSITTPELVDTYLVLSLKLPPPTICA